MLSQVLQRTDRQRERSSQLVRDVGEEPRLRVIERLELDSLVFEPRVLLGKLAFSFTQCGRAFVYDECELTGATFERQATPANSAHQRKRDDRDHRPPEPGRL